MNLNSPILFIEINKLEKNSMKIESINLNDLMLRLSKADKKLTPK